MYIVFTCYILHQFTYTSLDNFFVSVLLFRHNHVRDVSTATGNSRSGVTVKRITSPATLRDHGVLCQPGTILLRHRIARVFERLHRCDHVVQHRRDIHGVHTSRVCAFQNSQVTLVLLINTLRGRSSAT